MELLGALEKKIESLLVLVRELRLEKSVIEAENIVLKQQLDSLEAALLKNREENNYSKESAQKAIDALISNIDGLLSEVQQ